MIISPLSQYKTVFSLTFFMMLVWAMNVHARVIYVKPTGNDVNSGNSWGQAYQTLQKALAVAVSSDEIWVAAGTYTPTNTTDRSLFFSMKNGVGIYGGFNGTETLRSQRNFTTNVTILSGNIGDQHVKTDNSFNVINNVDVNNTAVLDGFTITGGHANGGLFPTFAGGGMLNENSSPIITNCHFTDNYASNRGGAMLNYSSSAPLISRCKFTGNTANGGGAICNFDATMVMEFCIVSGNSSSLSGGAIFNDGSGNQTIRNSLITGNVSEEGGALYNYGGSNVQVINCTFSGNVGTFSSGVSYNLGVSGAFPVVNFINCIIWGNNNMFQGSLRSSLSHCIYQMDLGFVEPGTGNLNMNPRFIQQPAMGLSTEGDFHVQGCSPGLNAGLNSANTATVDLDGNPRVVNSIIDMGAYEFQGAPVCCPPENILYVKFDATGSNDGSSWQNAKRSLQEALASLELCPLVTEVWVAAGIYKPTTGTDRALSFFLRNGVAVYGGFNGTETMRSQRNWVSNVTTLSGDIGVANNAADNSYHVFYNASLNNTAMLDGFTIEQGNANGSAPGENTGGAMFNTATASPTIRNCIFKGNTSMGVGGAVWNTLSSAPVFENCMFTGNASGSGGGAVANNNSSPGFVNCVFLGNVSEYQGGALHNSGSSPTLVNCSFSGNDSWPLANGGTIYSWNNSNPVVTNCIVWGNRSSIINNGANTIVTYSIVEGGYPGTGNSVLDPKFVSQPPVGLGTSGNLRLQSNSPAIHAGQSSANTTTVDLDGNPRVVGSSIDMGAYEFAGSGPTPSKIIYLDVTAKGNNDGSSWANAFISLDDALRALNTYQVAEEIHMAWGIYSDPSPVIYTFDRPNVIVLGGFPSGGGTRDVKTYPVIIRGEVRFLKNATLDGIEIIKRNN